MIENDPISSLRRQIRSTSHRPGMPPTTMPIRLAGPTMPIPVGTRTHRALEGDQRDADDGTRKAADERPAGRGEGQLLMQLRERRIVDEVTGT
ncbi:hypothetical protein [Nocardia sp. NPDC005998]|uniref:hypothetical protein n=1 Tax=Nocardia sp. NPDC005998 TaxID=3156894 RepID=UPI0033BCC8E2